MYSVFWKTLSVVLMITGISHVAHALELQPIPNQRVQVRFNVLCDDGRSLLFTANLRQSSERDYSTGIVGGFQIFLSTRFYPNPDAIPKYYIKFTYRDGVEEERQLQRTYTNLPGRSATFTRIINDVDKVYCNSSPTLSDDDKERLKYTTHVEITGANVATLYFNNKTGSILRCKGTWFYRARANHDNSIWTGTSSNWNGGNYSEPFTAFEGLSTHTMVLNAPYSFERVQVLDLSCKKCESVMAIANCQPD